MPRRSPSLSPLPPPSLDLVAGGTEVAPVRILGIPAISGALPVQGPAGDLAVAIEALLRDFVAGLVGAVVDVGLLAASRAVGGSCWAG